MSVLSIQEFTPLRLSIDRIGPFQNKMEEIDFTDENGESCNLFLLLSKNGRGKTTTLELMRALMGMLGYQTAGELALSNERLAKFPIGSEFLDSGPGRAQWDIRVAYSEDGVDEVAVFSLIAGQVGSDTSLKFWDEDALISVGAKSWHRFGFSRNEAGSWTTVGAHDNWVTDLNAAISIASGQKVGGFEDGVLVWPTLIYFSAYRNVIPITVDQERAIVAPRDWNYRPVHAFRTEGGDWRDSLDNLLVWLKWLDDQRYERALKLVNARVFSGTNTFIKGISKEPPEAQVVRDGNVHRLDALSSGEKSLVQLFLRLGAHMTSNTILLIDEPEAHLHENWKFRLFSQLKELCRDNFPSLTIIAATHSPEMMTSLALELEEQNLRKGGYLFESEEDAHRVALTKQDATEKYGNVQG